jgi:eukaryotic-like serine/threonine-protein kinase
VRTPSSHQNPLIGKIIGGRYEVVRLIGKGAHGSVYEVKSTRLARSFAMKTLTSEKAGDARSLERFRREADVIARLKHPNIVEVIDWETLDDGSPAMIMEYLRGEDLATRIEAGPLAWPLLARIAEEMLAAVSIAHAHGVVHRDLKPENVFLAKDDAGDERVKLLDFGVSKVRDAKGFVTTDDTVLGTPAYMSPEQADGRLDDVGTHSDVWSAGAILFEMATGEVAFSAPSVPSILYKICHGKPASMLEHRPDAPPAFVELVTDAFTKETKGRIADVAVLRARLRESLADLPGVRFAEPLPPVVAKAPANETATIDATLAAKSPALVSKTPALAAMTDAGRVTSPSVIQRRKLAPLAFVMLGIAAIAVVTTIVVATRDKPAKSSAAITTPREATPHEATTPSPALSNEAAATTEATATPGEATAASRDAATTGAGATGEGSSSTSPTGSGREPTREASRPPARSATPRKIGAPPAESAPTPPPSVEPTTVAPKKKACAKDDVECLYGDGT